MTPFSIKHLRQERSSDGLRLIIIIILAMFWLTTIHRPYLPHLYPTYQGFGDSDAWRTWGRYALGISILMTFSSPGGVFAQIAALLASIFFFITTGIFTTSSGISTATTTYSALGMAGVILFGLDFRSWFPRTRLFRKIVSMKPSGWFPSAREEPDES